MESYFVPFCSGRCKAKLISPSPGNGQAIALWLTVLGLPINRTTGATRAQNLKRIWPTDAEKRQTKPNEAYCGSSLGLIFSFWRAHPGLWLAGFANVVQPPLRTRVLGPQFAPHVEA